MQSCAMAQNNKNNQISCPDFRLINGNQIDFSMCKTSKDNI